MSRLRTYGEQLLPWLVWLAFFLLYALTAAPSIAALFDDTLEFNLVLPTFGIAHPTGYPLYTVLGGLWTWLLPVGNWAWRTSLFSAVTAAATVALVFVLTRRLTRLETGKPDLWAGLAAAVVFGLGLVWWAQATVAEVYALHNLLVAAMLVTATAAARTEVGNGHHTSGRPLALLFLLLGLGLAHHRTVVLLVPGLAIYLLLRVPGIWRPRPVWALWLGALFLPLLLYAYIPLRAAAGVHDLNNSYTNTWDGFWNHVLARGYTGFFAANALAQPRSPASWLALWLEQMGWAGVLLALSGLAALRQRTARSEVILLLIVLITNLLFALVYQVSDQEVFLIPAFMVAAVLAGYGLAALRQASRRPLLATSIGALALVLLLWGPGRGPTVDRSQAWAVHDYAVDMAKVAFPPGSRVIGIEGELTALRYMQEAEGLGLAATPVVADDPAVRRDQLAAAVAAGAPAYLTRELDGVAGAYSFSGAGPLVRVWPRGQAVAGAPSQRTDLLMNDGRLRLEGYDLQRLEWAGGPVVRLVLYWRPVEELGQDLKLSLRAVDSTGQPLRLPGGETAVVDVFPLRRVAPTTTWLPGEVVRDVHEVRVPRPLPEDARLLAILYDAGTVLEVGRLELPLFE